jgi:frataxin-like iron-binding protein CyaY
MKIYAQIENGKVVNTVVANDEFAAQQGWVLCENGGIGWDYINGQFVDNRSKPEIETAPAAPTKEDLLAQLNALQAQIQALS